MSSPAKCSDEGVAVRALPVIGKCQYSQGTLLVDHLYFATSLDLIVAGDLETKSPANF